ncbi:MAG TPA: histone deacetylase family protein, partial [Allocoleopsis sp.]
LIDGKLMPPVENPQRADRILAALTDSGLGQILPANDFGLESILRVHDPQFVAFLQTAWQRWVVEHGDWDALPLNWATRTMRHDRIPETIEGKLSYYSFDAGTPIIAGTWDAAYGAAMVALTAQERLLQGGVNSVFALCRPPGHHAAADIYGGYCFLNNAAIAAQAVRDRGVDRVTILDVDYHHGNGTQAIFYDRADVQFISLHAHPSQSYPYFLGYDDETGSGAGVGYNHNYPFAIGTQWEEYAVALTEALHQIRQYNPDVVVVSLGVDTYEKDPISLFRLKTDDYRRMAGMIAALDRPTLIVLEGGYALEEIGVNVVRFLEGFETV